LFEEEDMAQNRLPMTKLKEILRLRIGEERSLRTVSRSVKCSPSKVHAIEVRARMLGVTWPPDPSMDWSTVEALIYDSMGHAARRRKTEPDWAYIHKELKRKHVTLFLLWQEYKEADPEGGYQYSRFCELYSKYRKQLQPEFRNSYKAGEKGFVDWSGDGIQIVRRETGEVWEAPMFVGTLGASGYTYATAKADRTLHNWIDCHCQMYEFFGGVPELTIPDNEKTGVTSACYYDPELNPTYRHMSQHYDTSILPTRPRKPKEKALVENAVLNAQRWILAALRNHTFFSLEEANAAIAEKLEAYNRRSMQLLKASRAELFAELDQPALKPLPARRYDFAEWSRARVHIDYHIRVDKHHYSVPYKFVGEVVEASRTRNTVEVFFKGNRIAVHRRLYNSRNPSTQAEHMPPAHRNFAEWTPARFIRWAGGIGPFTQRLIELNLESRRHPEQAYRGCLGILRLGRNYGKERLEAACQRALFVNTIFYRSIHSILEKGLDQKPLPGMDMRAELLMPAHDNIRGPEDYN
jgi:transposase